jgi:UDP-2,3-diacylglucosamine pyrophosphatase LpxH
VLSGDNIRTHTSVHQKLRLKNKYILMSTLFMLLYLRTLRLNAVVLTFLFFYVTICTLYKSYGLFRYVIIYEYINNFYNPGMKPFVRDGPLQDHYL